LYQNTAPKQRCDKALVIASYELAWNLRLKSLDDRIEDIEGEQLRLLGVEKSLKNAKHGLKVVFSLNRL